MVIIDLINNIIEHSIILKIFETFSINSFNNNIPFKYILTITNQFHILQVFNLILTFKDFIFFGS